MRRKRDAGLEGSRANPRSAYILPRQSRTITSLPLVAAVAPFLNASTDN
jgi:hypothetical protein